MLRRWLGFGRQSNRAITESLYGEIVAAARQPAFYSHWNVPDTPLGRYEMVALHMFLFLHRLRNEGDIARDVAQDVTDVFFRDIEHSLRELGVSDQGVPKRMKKLARMFYGRAMAYGSALDNGDARGLAEALERNIQPENGRAVACDSLARYVFGAWDALAGQAGEGFLAGNIVFPRPVALEGTAL
jgi:cytochrome b pre-mRNA-processing protein 3